MRVRGSGAAAWWATIDVTRRWRALVALGVLIGVTGGMGLAALAGARRTETALERLKRDTRATNAMVFAGQVGANTAAWNGLRARPEVTAVAVWDLVFGELDGKPGTLFFASSDGGWLGQVNRPLVTEGRMYDPAASDEVVVSEALHDPVKVGDTYAFRPYGPGQDDTSGDPATGPKVTLKVVGKVRTVNQFLFSADQVFLPPGFIKRYGDQINIFENADVRLRDPRRDVAALQRDVSDVVAPGTPVLDLGAASRRVDTTVAVERAALLLLGIAIALAGGVLVAQPLGRSAGLIGDHARVLRAVGMTRREVTLAAVLSHAVTGVVAAVAAFAIAIAVSPLFPLGLGRKIDPAVGVHADWSVIGPGVVLVGGLVLGATALIAWWACRPHIDDRPVRPSRLLTVIRRSAPLTGGLGASIALGGAMGRNRVSVRPALIAAVVAVLSVVGTLTIDQGISDALAHPARAGVAWDATAVPLNQRVAADIDPAWQGKVLGAVPTGTRSAEADRAVIVANGVGAPAFALRALATQSSVRVALVTTSGRAPSRDDEAAIGPKTARDIHAKVGDTIAVGPQNQPVRIVGTALFPSDVHAEFDEGLWITTALFDATAPRGDFAQTREIVLDFPARTNVRAAISRLSGVLGNDAESVSTPETPAELTNLHNVRTLPVLLAVFLALIGIAALGHELITSARRGRHDFAVLRALGLNRSATRLILNAQATVICLVGLAFGLPLGVAVGRVGWRLVTDKVPLAYIAPFPPLGVMLTIAAAMVLANVIALWPGQQVADQLPARALRAD